MGAAQSNLENSLVQFEAEFSKRGLMTINVLDEGESVEYEVNHFITDITGGSEPITNSIELPEEIDFHDVMAVVKYIITQKGKEEPWFQFGSNAKDIVFAAFLKLFFSINKFWVNYNGQLIPLSMEEVYNFEKGLA